MPVHADVKDLLTVMDEVLSEEGKADGAASMTQEYKDAQAEWLRICQGWKHDYPVVLPAFERRHGDRGKRICICV